MLPIFFFDEIGRLSLTAIAFPIIFSSISLFALSRSTTLLLLRRALADTSLVLASIFSIGISALTFVASLSIRSAKRALCSSAISMGICDISSAALLTLGGTFPLGGTALGCFILFTIGIVIGAILFGPPCASFLLRGGWTAVIAVALGPVGAGSFDAEPGSSLAESDGNGRLSKAARLLSVLVATL